MLDNGAAVGVDSELVAFAMTLGLIQRLRTYDWPLNQCRN